MTQFRHLRLVVESAGVLRWGRVIFIPAFPGQFTSGADSEQLSIPLLLEELHDITEVTLLYPDPRVVRRIARMSPMQTRLWKLFGLAKYQAPG